MSTSFDWMKTEPTRTGQGILNGAIVPVREFESGYCEYRIGFDWFACTTEVKQIVWTGV